MEIFNNTFFLFDYYHILSALKISTGSMINYIDTLWNAFFGGVSHFGHPVGQVIHEYKNSRKYLFYFEFVLQK